MGLENLPDDVLCSDIFIRLPAKLLARIRCCSKHFNSLLSQPYFIKSHLDRSIHNNDKNELLLLFYMYNNFTTHPSRSPHLNINDFVKLPVNILLGKGAYKVIGSVNGLICLSVYNTENMYSIYIWNPSLSALLPLPQYDIQHRNSFDVQFRFGYDPKTDDYKIVKLTSAYVQVRRNYNVFRKWQFIEVYSMRYGFWKFIGSVPSHITLLEYYESFCVDGHCGYLHWLGCYEKEEVQIIVAFDLGSDCLDEIYLPDSIADKNVDNIIGALDRKLCVISRVIDDDCGYYREVWVMNEYGVTESWVKNHVISQFSVAIKPIGFTLNNELVFKTPDKRMALYDPVEAKVKLFKTIADAFYFYVTYVDSLVWVIPAKIDSAIATSVDSPS